jgi:hypothetical protein
MKRNQMLLVMILNNSLVWKRILYMSYMLRILISKNNLNTIKKKQLKNNKKSKRKI